MPTLPDRARGHLVVAAVRVFAEREKRPPTSAEVAEQLGWHPDPTLLACRQLSEAGILASVESPYDVRYEVGDHHALERLEAEDRGPGFEEEMQEHAEQLRRKQEEMERLFGGGAEEERRKKIEGMDEDFDRFRKKKKPRDPFA